MSNPKQIEINGATYVLEGSTKLAEKMDGMPYVIIRTYSAGVHAGYLAEESSDGKKVKLLKSRRIHYWEGAASLSQLSVDGTNRPKECRFSCEVAEMGLTEAIENISCTQKAIDSIQGVEIWKV